MSDVSALSCVGKFLGFSEALTCLEKANQYARENQQKSYRLSTLRLDAELPLTGDDYYVTNEPTVLERILNGGINFLKFMAEMDQMAKNVPGEGW